MKSILARFAVPHRLRLAGSFAFIGLSTFSPQFSTCLAQGSLTPPGPPATTMKSLDQIEPRVPVDAAHTPGNSTNLYNISQSGSYYLTTNIVVASGNGIGI